MSQLKNKYFWIGLTCVALVSPIVNIDGQTKPWEAAIKGIVVGFVYAAGYLIGLWSRK